MHGTLGSAPPGPFDPGPAKSVVTSAPWPLRVLKRWTLLNVSSTANAVVPSAEKSMSVAIAASSMSIFPTRVPSVAFSFTIPKRMMSWNDGWYLFRLIPPAGNGVKVSSGKSAVPGLGVRIVFRRFFTSSMNASGSRLKRPLLTLFCCAPPTQS